MGQTCCALAATCVLMANAFTPISSSSGALKALIAVENATVDCALARYDVNSFKWNSGSCPTMVHLNRRK